jgi:hypothetical protein
MADYVGEVLMWPFKAARRAALEQCAPSSQEYRNTPSPGKAAGGPRRGFAPQAQAA